MRGRCHVAFSQVAAIRGHVSEPSPPSGRPSGCHATARPAAAPLWHSHTSPCSWSFCYICASRRHTTRPRGRGSGRSPCCVTSAPICASRGCLPLRSVCSCCCCSCTRGTALFRCCARCAQSVSQFYTTPSTGHRLARSRPSPDERVFLPSRNEGVLTEWLFWEFLCFHVGTLGPTPLAVHSVRVTKRTPELDQN